MSIAFEIDTLWQWNGIRDRIAWSREHLEFKIYVVYRCKIYLHVFVLLAG